jgi:nucleotide-binding universal stress UspA family protein/CBS domain-containing protein
MQLIRDVMTRAVEVADPQETLADASSRMLEHNVGALPVWHGGQLVGVITDRDITVRAVAAGHDPSQAKVGDFMTPNVVAVHEDESVEEAARMMGQHHVRRLIVLNRIDRMVGIVTMSDLAVDTGDERLAAEVLERVSAAQRIECRPYKRILVALDGSELAESVLPHVEPIARIFDSTVTLLRVLSPQEAGVAAEAGAATMAHVLPADEVRSLAEHVRRDAVGYLTAVHRRLIASGLSAEYEYPEGRPAEIIVQRARHLGADLIAMTTHGRGAMGRVVFGSVAGEVLRTAPCPLLVVRNSTIES